MPSVESVSVKLLSFVATATLLASLCCAQQGSPALYVLTEKDIARMQERAEALRVSGQSGWEQAYIAIARAEWDKGDRGAAVSRLTTTLLETQSCEQRDLAHRAAAELLTQPTTTEEGRKEQAPLAQGFVDHTKKTVLSLPVDQQSMSGGCGVAHASLLRSASSLWQKTDPQAAEQAARNMLTIAALLSQSQSRDLKSEAQLFLSRLFEDQGKYDLALSAYDEAIQAIDFTQLGADATFVEEIMRTKRVELLSLYQPGADSTRAALATRLTEVRNLPLPWSQRAALLSSLLRPLELEKMTNERIDALIHFVHVAPDSTTATQDEEAVVVTFLSTLQGADHPMVARPDAAIFALNELISRTADVATRDSLIAERERLIARTNQ